MAGSADFCTGAGAPPTFDAGSDMGIGVATIPAVAGFLGTGAETGMGFCADSGTATGLGAGLGPAAGGDAGFGAGLVSGFGSATGVATAAAFAAGLDSDVDFLLVSGAGAGAIAAFGLGVVS